MSYIVVYQRSDGSSGLEECTTLDLAVVAAERLRNVDAVENPRIFKTEEVKFDFRPYYRVEVSTDGEPSTVSAADPAPARPSTPVPVADTPAAEAVAPDLPPPPVETSEPAPPPPTDESHDAANAAPADAEAATIDPWAAAEGSPIDYSLDREAPAAAEPSEEVAEAAPEAESAETEVEAEDMGSSARGLFSTSSLPDPPTDASDAAQLADEVSEAVPPRRGLFGR